MTLTLAWLRTEAGSDELVVASDSRLRGGYEWDAAPKILPLPRSDSVIAFAGATDVAYPMMIQAVNTVTSWTPASTRRQPLDEFKGHLLRVFNRMLVEVSDPLRLGMSEPDALFLLAGFNWRWQRFQVWTLHFDHRIRRFTFRPASRWSGGNANKLLAIVGDEVALAKERIIELLKARGKLPGAGFDMEPLEILEEFIRDEAHATIGGSPQVLKVYQSMNVVPFIVPWTDKTGGGIMTLYGRPLLDYEDPVHPRLERGSRGWKAVDSSAPGSLANPTDETVPDVGDR